METDSSGGHSVDPTKLIAGRSSAMTNLKQNSSVISHASEQLGTKWVTLQAWHAEPGELSGDLRPVWESRN